MVMVNGNSSAVVVEPLMPGNAPTMMPMSVPAKTTMRIFGSSSSAIPPRKASILGEQPFRQLHAEAAHENEPDHGGHDCAAEQEQPVAALAPQVAEAEEEDEHGRQHAGERDERHEHQERGAGVPDHGGNALQRLARGRRESEERRQHHDRAEHETREGLRAEAARDPYRHLL